MNQRETNANELTSLHKFYLIAAIICTVNAAPFIGGLINSQLYNFLYISALVISVMLLIKQSPANITKMPHVLAFIGSVLGIVTNLVSDAMENAMLDFASDFIGMDYFSLVENMTSGLFVFTPSQIDTLAVIMAMAGIGLISWLLMVVASILFFVNVSIIKKMAPTN